MQHSHGLLSNPLLPGSYQGGHAAGRGDAAGCNPLPLLARDRLEVGGFPSCMGCWLLFPLNPMPVPTCPRTPSTRPPRALPGLHTRARCLLLGISSHPPAQTIPCPALLFLLSIPFISTSSLNHPICLPLLLPTALHHKSGRSLAGSRVRVLRGWGTMHSVGRKGDCTLSTAKFEESSVALAPLLSTHMHLGGKKR